MTTLREAAQMALDALNSSVPFGWSTSYVDKHRAATESLRAALAQPEQEPVWGDSQVTKPEIVAEQKAMNEGLRKMVEQKPVAWRKKWEGDEDYTYYWMNRYKGSEPLYTAPPQREWVGLTDEEYESMAENHVTDYFFDTLKYAHAIEAKLKEKNT